MDVWNISRYFKIIAYTTISREITDSILLIHCWESLVWATARPLKDDHSTELHLNIVGRVAQSLYRLTTGWTVRRSNPGGGEIFRICPDRPWGPPTSCAMGTGSFPGVKSSRGVTLTPHPILVPRSRKSRDIPPLPLWAVRPVYSLGAWTEMHVTFFCI